ncbi:uncharacterized protein LOC111408317 [Olea europaea var. sylvestris]|uniref:uncharacterized protein LOC111408317 n=1 Tax=Olea europaea var. sylvestris TaxID=158386 RepID=UPI000C1CF7D5|nr:uncharacterized protein LOC111408317 [Olea europaea var. sylvestris]
MGHRRFLALSHLFRMKRSWFDGHIENGISPKIKTGEENSSEVDKIVNDWSKSGKRKRKKNTTQSNVTWKKKSIFCRLPYWKTLLIRHNLDVMHVEKNICESIINTLLNVKGKSKDSINYHKDLKAMNIRHDLHSESRENKFYLPVAPHTLSKAEKQMFCKRLATLRLPNSYGSNMANCISVEECKIVRLKSHYCHLLMQQLLSVALRGLLPKGPRNFIFKLCSFFNEICQGVIDRNKVEILEEDVSETLCMLERYFPPSFFNIMVHLKIHIGREVRLCGPVQYRWMYPFERYMKVLKEYVMNRARPKGSIAERYIFEENAMFCSKYIKQTSEIGSRTARNEEYESDFLVAGVQFLKGSHLMHMDELKSSDKRLGINENLLHKKHVDTFATWLHNKLEVHISTRLVFNSVIHSLIPNVFIIITDCRPIVAGQYAENSRQNSGILVEATTICRSSAKDNAHVVDKVLYYGVLRDIIVLDYNTFHIPIFWCDWANIVNGIKKEDGFTLVNLHQGQGQFENDPFILASQAKQVFYSREENETSNWYVVLQASPRDFHVLHMEEDTSYGATIPLDVTQLEDNHEKDENFARIDIAPMIPAFCSKRISNLVAFSVDV